MGEAEARATLMVDAHADFDDIRRAHRVMVRLLHPDRAGDALMQDASDALVRINLAWEVLQGRHRDGLLGQAEPAAAGVPAAHADAPTSAGIDPQTVPVMTVSRWQVTAREPQGTACRLCGCSPVMDLNAVEVRSWLLAWRRVRYHGAYCRDCGTTLRRQVAQGLLTRGLWGAALPVSLWYLLVLFVAQVRLSGVPRAQFREINMAVPYRAPLPAGRPVWKRDATLIVATVAVALDVVAVAAVVGLVSGHPWWAS